MPKGCKPALAATVLALAWCKAATGVTIDPVVIQLSHAGRSATVRVSNPGSQALRLQAQVFAWTQEGQERRQPSQDLLVAPTIAELAPGATQVFRIALRRPQPSPRERAYRLLLEDISPASGDSGALAQIRLNHDLPVLVAPAGPAVHALDWSACPAPAMAPPSPGAGGCLRLANQGSLRVKFDALTLTGPVGEQRVTLPAARNLLAGGVLDITLPVAGPPRPDVDGVTVHPTEGAPMPARATRAP